MTSSVVATHDTLISRLLSSIEGLDTARIAELYDEEASSLPIEQRLIHSGLLDSRQLAKLYADHYLLPLFDPAENTPLPIDPALAKLLPSEFCCQHHLLPLNDDGKTLEVAVSSPDSLVLADSVREKSGRQMRPFFTTMSVVARGLRILYGNSPAETNPADAKPVVVNDISANVSRLMRKAIRAGASQVLIEPSACTKQHRVRMRTDGVLSECEFMPTVASGVTDYLKSLARIGADPSARLQQGSIRVRDGERRVDVGVNFLPTASGQRIDLQLPGHWQSDLQIESLGFSDYPRQSLASAISQDAGMLLVSGPVRSGKRTTLYSCLQHLNEASCKSICTVEDHISIRVGGINQIQVDSHDRPRFHEMLQHIIRSRPDVVLLDQIRDSYSAATMVSAAMSGQFVLSSVPASDTAAMLESLFDLGVSRNQIANSVHCLIAQRLVRRLCSACSSTVPATDEQLARLRGDATLQLQQAVGCGECGNTGYRGQVPICETLMASDTLANKIRSGESSQRIRESAQELGTFTLAQSARLHLVSGETSFSEVAGLL